MRPGTAGERALPHNQPLDGHPADRPVHRRVTAHVVQSSAGVAAVPHTYTRAVHAGTSDVTGPRVRELSVDKTVHTAVQSWPLPGH